MYTMVNRGGRGLRKYSVYKVSLREITLNLVCKHDNSIEMYKVWSEATALSSLLCIFRDRLQRKTHQLLVYADLVYWAKM
jgi:hypothetical protein